MLNRKLSMEQYRHCGTACPAKVSHHKTIDSLSDKTSKSLGFRSSSEAHAMDVPLGSVHGMATLPPQ
jgi:hypothetical protein